VGTRSLGGKAPDGGARRWLAATAAVCCGSGEGARCRANKRWRTPLGVLEDALEARVCDGDGRRRWRSGSGAGGAVGGGVGARRGKALGFYRRDLPVMLR
jgi:hypothetical protein